MFLPREAYYGWASFRPIGRKPKFNIDDTLSINMNIPFAMPALYDDSITFDLANNLFALAPKVFHGAHPP